jgi:pectate disaccharide-lyase
MKKNLLLFYCLLLASASVLAQQVLYVSPTGSASSSGTSISAPTTFQNAIATITPGGTINMRGGTYNFSATIVIASTNNGTAGAVKTVSAYNGEIPILDFAGQALADANRGIVLDGDYWYFKGITIRNAGDNGMLLSGNHNTIDNCIFTRNRDSGLQLSRFSSSATTISTWPSFNLILNCEAFDNKDAVSENADGFAAKLTCGEGNVFRGCISHNNSDDGWDLFTKTDTGPIGVVTFDNCVAYNNGTLTDGTTSSNGDKNGFKLGGSGIPVNHIIRRCVAFGNGHHGFTDNNNLGNITVTNNTSYNNVESNFNFREGGNHTFTNNLSFNAGASDKTIGTDVSGKNVWWKNNVSTSASNLVVSSADFVSLTPTVAKNADGSPNLGNFLALATGSDMINAGVSASGITFNGSAPDIGARESGNTTTTFTLTTTASPSTGGSVARSPNASSYASGTVVTLTAVPATGFIFSGWSGDASGTNTSTTITMNANKTVTANFTASTTSFTLTTTANPSTGGTITRSPNATSYASGTVVTLTATPASGFSFGSWSGSVTGTSTSITVTMNANKTVTANFTASTTSFTLTTTANPSTGGTITRSPNATSYANGTIVTLTATPSSGFSFGSWSGGATGTTTSTTVTMNANKTVTANFNANTGNTTLRIDDKAATGTGYCSADGSRQNTFTGADGGFYVNLSNASGKGITWAMRAGAAGNYTLKWRYANAGSASATTARVLVNGTQAIASVAFPKTTTWDTWTTTASVTVTLVTGTNKIRLETTVASEFANIDWIEITGNNPTETLCSNATGARVIATEVPKTIDPAGEMAIIFPNPSNGISTLRFAVARQQKVSVTMYAADGRAVKTITDKVFAPGIYYTAIDGKGLKAGIYFIVINADGRQTVLKNVLLQ